MNSSILQMLVNNPIENKNPGGAIRFESTDHKWPSGHQFATSGFGLTPYTSTTPIYILQLNLRGT